MATALMKLPGKLLIARDRVRGAGDNGLPTWLREQQPSSARTRGALGSPPSLVGDPCKAMLSAKLVADLRHQQFNYRDSNAALVPGTGLGKRLAQAEAQRHLSLISHLSHQPSPQPPWIPYTQQHREFGSAQR